MFLCITLAIKKLVFISSRLKQIMKKDNPLRMIKSGRYKACFDTLSPDIQSDVLKPEGMQKLAKVSFFMPLMKFVVPLGFSKKSGKGWKYVWHKDTDGPNEFHFECTECLYKHIFTKYGVIDRFGPMFCHSDIINYGNLPYTDFIRTQTLCQGGELCDFCFIRHRKDEQWERTKSI